MSGQNTYTVWTKYISCLDKYHILSGQISYPVLTNTISCLCKYHILSGQILYPVLTNIISCHDKYHIVSWQISYRVLTNIIWYLDKCYHGLFPSVTCLCSLVDILWSLLTFVTSTPVILLTMVGTLTMMSSTSPVILAAPTSPLPSLTIVIFLAWDRGAAISAATWDNQRNQRNT